MGETTLFFLIFSSDGRGETHYIGEEVLGGEGSVPGR